ncbi:MAG: metallo-beta-lactamase, partial [Spirosoma sp.]|nr:metallo-beta-lactamase [Spirosoma sp.]
ERYSVAARVEIMDSFSAHGDYQEMMEFLSCQDATRVKTVFLVHGDYEKQIIWREKLQAAGFNNVVIPDMQEKANL